MKASQLPAKIPVIFASGANATYVRQGGIPNASQIGITDGAWSFTDGSPPLNFLPTGSGGVPPDGRDFNALMEAITAWTRWQSAGGRTQFDASFAAAVGGYPQSAIVASTTVGKLWLCTADGNTTDPDSAQSANWVALYTPASAGSIGIIGGTPHPYYTPGTYSLTIPANRYAYATRCIAGGGGGGGASGTNAAGSGGGGGGYGYGTLSCTPGDTLTIVVGAGGAGGANGASPAGGANGGTSSVAQNGTIVIASTGGGNGFGGNGGPQQSQYGSGGASSGGQIALSGNLGGYPVPVGSAFLGGVGGSVPFGGSIPANNLGNVGIAGTFPGGGGNGSSYGASGTGGQGAGGAVEIYF